MKDVEQLKYKTVVYIRWIQQNTPALNNVFINRLKKEAQCNHVRYFTAIQLILFFVWLCILTKKEEFGILIGGIRYMRLGYFLRYLYILKIYQIVMYFNQIFRDTELFRRFSELTQN